MTNVKMKWLVAFAALVAVFLCWKTKADEAKAVATRPLQIGSLRVGKILFLGNSITLHGPAPKIGWDGNWGMAASARERDYVHLLLAQIGKQAGGEPHFRVKNIADFERQLDSYDVKEKLKEELAFGADIVVVAIGENVAALSTDDAKAKYKAAFTGLLKELSEHESPTLFVRSSFWANPAKDEIMRQACQDAGGAFVDISKRGSDPANAARPERKFEHEGVAAHPGDRGMQAIADALLAAIEKRAATPRE
jgi:hypothetical protein